MSSKEKMIEKIEAMQALAKQRKADKGAAAPEIKKEAERTEGALQLPAWPENVRGVPNLILRSALFSAIKPGRRKYIRAELLAAVDGVTIRCTGERLDQADLDVWEQCLHLARVGGLGVEIRFTGNGFLKAIGRATGKSQHEWLKSVFRRLMTSLVELANGEKVYAGQLVHNWYRDKESGHHVMELNEKIVAIFGTDGWSAVEWRQRLALSRQTSKWLHGFYSTHAKPYPMKVETMHRISGSEAKLLSDYRKYLHEALVELGVVTGWNCTIVDDLVQITKTPSAAQARHLLKKATQPKARHSTPVGTA